ncbi:MAG TPA: M48 family metalloprotease [Terriglobales bacterium]|jgi:Zn-dependent protease with chaperone function
MRNCKGSLLLLATLTVFSFPLIAEDKPANSASQVPATSVTTTQTNLSAPSSFDQVIDRVVARERAFNEQMRGLQPLVETYIQTLSPDHELGLVPASDNYFLGRLSLKNGVEDRSFLEPPKGQGFLSRFAKPFPRFISRGFAQMAIMDSSFDRSKYDFAFVRREFLGEVRCLVIDVQPKKDTGNGRFIGRIWVEDQDYNVVRFNGTYGPIRRPAHYFHFDSWRLNMRQGVWLPAYIYSEESHIDMGLVHDLTFKAQTRLWGYNLGTAAKNEEFTQIVIDSPQTVQDQSQAAQDATPVESQRMWERQAEDNSIERMEKVGLLAPQGEVDKVLQTVANNLIVTNNLNIEPEVRTRVLLTLPLESFTVGHTIVLSRGLLDVLPDEASLAMVIGHELSHIALGHRLDTTLAFNDKMFFNDENTMSRLDFAHDPAEEAAADKRAMELLANSPYKDKLQSSALFLKVLQARAPDLKHLIRSHMGNNLADGKDTVRMAALLQSAPQLDMRKTDQIAALPLGARIKLDPWTSRIELVKTKPVALTSAREKMPFEVTPFFPYLTRINSPGAEKIAQAPAK